jgi:hypothetical protein
MAFVDELVKSRYIAPDDLERFRDKLTIESLIPEARARTRVSLTIFRPRLEEYLNHPDLGPDRDWLRNFIDQILDDIRRVTEERNQVMEETKWLEPVKELVAAAERIGAKIVLLWSGSQADRHLIEGLCEHNLMVAKQLGPGRSEYRILGAPESLSVEGEGELATPKVLVARIASGGPLYCEPGENSVDLRFTQATICLKSSGPDGEPHSHLKQMDVTVGTEVRLRLTERAPTLEALGKKHTRAALLVAAIFSALCLGFGIIAGLVLRHESLLYLGLVGALIGLPGVFVVVHRDLHADVNIRSLPPANWTPSQYKYDLEADKYVFGQERARVTAYVGGIATAAAGFIATLVVALLKGEVSRTIGPWWPTGALAGAVVLVGYATFLSLTLRPLNRRFSERHPQ